MVDRLQEQFPPKPSTDSADNVTFADVIGSKDDTTGGDSIVAVAKQIVEDTGTTIPATVDEIPSETNAKTFNDTALASIEGECEDALEGENLDHLIKDAVDTNLQTTVADNSVDGYKLAKANVSNYDRTTDSQEAIGEVVAGIQTDLDNGTDGLGALKILIDANQTDLDLILADVGDASGSTLGSIYGILGNPATTITADIATIDGKCDTISTAVVTDIPATITTMQGNVTDILLDTGTTIPGTITTLQTTADNIETDTQDIQTKIGTPTDTDLAIDISNVQTNVDIIKEATDVGCLGKTIARKTVTFSNTTGTVNLFTVTGDVLVKIVAVCTTNVASAAAANVEVGIAGSTGSIIPTTLSTDLADREIWHDNSPDSEIEAFSDASREYIISDGNDVVLTLSAQVDSGALNFYCIYTPLSTDGAVVSA